MKQTTKERNDLIYSRYLELINAGDTTSSAIDVLSEEFKRKPNYILIILRGFGVDSNTLKGTKNETRDEQIVKMFINGFDHATIADEYKITATRVGQIVRDALGKFSKLSALEKSLDQIKTDIEEGMDHKKIIEKYGTDLLNRIKRNLGFNAFEEFVNKRNSEILSMYESGKSAQEIADIYDVTRDHIYGILRKFGIKKRPSKQEYVKRNKSIVKDFNGGLNSDELAVKYNMTVTNINIILKNQDARSTKVEKMKTKIIEEFKSGKIVVNNNNITKVAKKYYIKASDVKNILKEINLI